MAVRQPTASRLSPRLAAILAGMVEAKLAAHGRSLQGRRTVSSDDPEEGQPYEERRHAR
jgi:hypothetical protein